MPPITITIDDSDSDSYLISKPNLKPKPKSKSKSTTLSSSPIHPSSSNTEADETLPDAHDLLFGLNKNNNKNSEKKNNISSIISSKSTENKKESNGNRNGNGGKSRFANLQHTSSPPPEIEKEEETSSPNDSFHSSSQKNNSRSRSKSKSKSKSQPQPTLNRLDSNISIRPEANAASIQQGKRSASSSSSSILLNGLDSLGDLNNSGSGSGSGLGSQLDARIGITTQTSKRKTISLPTKTTSKTTSNSTLDIPINLCDSGSESDQDDDGSINIKVIKPSTNKSRGIINDQVKGKGKGKGKQKEKEKPLFLGEENPLDYDSLEDEESERRKSESPLKKRKTSNQSTITTTTDKGDSDLEFNEDFGVDFSFSRLENEIHLKDNHNNRKNSVHLDKEEESFSSSNNNKGKGKGKGKEKEIIKESNNSKGKKREFQFDSDDSMNWDDEPSINSKKEKSNDGSFKTVEKEKTKAMDPATRAANAELKRVEKEEAKAERAREAAEKKAWKQVNLKATSREFRMTEVIVDIDSAYLKKISDPSLNINFEPILLEHGEALFQRLREDKAEVNEIEIGKGLKLSSQDVYNSNSILNQLDQGNINSKCRINSNGNSNGAGNENTILPTVRFRRRVNYSLDTKRRTKAPLPNNEIRTFIEPTTLILLTSNFITQLIKNELLLKEIQKIRNSTDVHHQIFVIVQGLNDDWKKDLMKKQREYTASIRRALDNPGNNNNNNNNNNNHASSSSDVLNGNELTKEKVEIELMRLRIALRAFVVNVNTKEDVADWIHNIACDVATRTDKLIDASHLSFCPDRAAKSASTSQDAYRLMLQSIPRITEHAANGIMAKYPTLRSLIEAYEHLDTGNKNSHSDTNESQLNMLTDCQISHRVNGQLSGRNVDKGLSRRVAQVLTGKDPLMLI